MRRIAFLFLLPLLYTLPAHADDASERAKIDQLFTTMHMERTMQQMMDAVEKSIIPMTQQLFGKEVPDSMRKEVAGLQKQMFDLVSDQMGWKAMEPAYVEIYTRNFTEEQIDDMIAFYKTPTGQAVIDKLPSITAEGVQVAQAKMSTLQPQIRKIMEDFATKHARDIKQARAMRKSGT